LQKFAKIDPQKSQFFKKPQKMGGVQGKIEKSPVLLEPKNFPRVPPWEKFLL